MDFGFWDDAAEAPGAARGFGEWVHIRPDQKFEEFIRNEGLKELGSWLRRAEIVYSVDEFAKLLSEIDDPNMSVPVKNRKSTALQMLVNLHPQNGKFPPIYLEYLKLLLKDSRINPNLGWPIAELIERFVRTDNDAEAKYLLEVAKLLIQHPNLQLVPNIPRMKHYYESWQQQTEQLLNLFMTDPKFALVWEMAKLRNEDETVDFMLKLVDRNHIFDEENLVGFDHPFITPFYNDIAREQRHLATQKLLVSQFGRAGLLPRDIWSGIFLRRRQAELCQDLSASPVNWPQLIYVSHYLRLPVKWSTGKNMTKSELCEQMAFFLTSGDYLHPEKWFNKREREMRRALEQREKEEKEYEEEYDVRFTLPEDVYDHERMEWRDTLQDVERRMQEQRARQEAIEMDIAQDAELARRLQEEFQ